MTTTTCPVGSKLTVTHGEQGRAEWCQATDQALANLPAPGRTSSGDIGLVQPPQLPGGVEGPFTAWYPTGVKEARGSYRNFGERSVPDGLWAFWYPSGALEVVGHYHRGEPIGCFASWDEQGVRHTGMVTGNVLTGQSCAPPSDAEVAVLTGHEALPSKEPIADVGLELAGGLRHFGVSNPDQAYPDPGLTMAFSAAPRVHLGRLRLGPTVGVRTSDASGYLAVLAGATVGWELPKLSPRVDEEIAIDVGVERMSVGAARVVNGDVGTADFVFWSPVAAARADVSLALTPQLAAVVGAGVDGWPGRSVETDGTYTTRSAFMVPVHESWTIGAIGFVANVGLRLLIR
jgi:hypothetical protein